MLPAGLHIPFTKSRIMKSMITDCRLHTKEVLSKLIQRTELIRTVNYYPTLSEGIKNQQDDPPQIIFTEIEPAPDQRPDTVWPGKEISTVIIKTDLPEARSKLTHVNFLYEPLRFKPFNEVVTQAFEKYRKTLPTSNPAIVITSGNRTFSFMPDQVLYMEAQADYVTLVAEESKQLLHITMKKLENLFAKAGFLRVHRSYIINPSKVEKSTSNAITINGFSIPIGRSYKNKFFQKFKQKRVSA
jgi:hypothetical protein